MPHGCGSAEDTRLNVTRGVVFKCVKIDRVALCKLKLSVSTSTLRALLVELVLQLAAALQP
jgi:hypothetical protein